MNEPLLSVKLEDFCVEIAETLSRFALRHQLDISSEKVLSLLGSSIPQFRKAAYFLLLQSENSILLQKFTSEEKSNLGEDDDDKDLESLELEKRFKERETILLSKINPGYLKFFKKSDQPILNENQMSYNHLDSISNKTQIDLLFPVYFKQTISDDFKLLEISAQNFEKRILKKLLFWSVLLKLADNEWETVVGDQIEFLLYNLFQYNPSIYQSILNEVFLYCKYKSHTIEKYLHEECAMDKDPLFVAPENFLSESTDTVPDSEICSIFALNILFMFCSRFPKTFRKHLNSPSGKKMASYAEQLMVQGLSKFIFIKEVKKIKQKKSEWEVEDFVVNSYPRSQEIIASLLKDETNIEMVISIPDKYPSKQASAKVDKSVKFPKKKIASWELMMKRLLTNHNVGVVKALQLWKANVDKQFDGIDPCPICYYVIHFGTKEMPSKVCRTCKSKFHSSCIHKWFQTSIKTECPMCKSQFI